MEEILKHAARVRVVELLRPINVVYRVYEQSGIVVQCNIIIQLLYYKSANLHMRSWLFYARSERKNMQRVRVVVPKLEDDERVSAHREFDSDRVGLLYLLRERHLRMYIRPLRWR